MKERKLIFNIAISACAVALLLSTGGFVYILNKSGSEEKTFKNLADIYHGADESTSAYGCGDAMAEDGSQADGTVLNREAAETSGLRSLKQENADFKFWLTLPGAGIDYPVMKREDAPEYYLHRDFYGSDSYSGTPFLGAGCDTDSDVMIIYAHNMKDGTMFGNLDNYKSEAFWKNNKDLMITTESGSRIYRIFGAFETSVDDKAFTYTDYVGHPDEDEFTEFIEAVKQRTPYDTGYVPYGDRIVMLSTCSYHVSGGRYVVVAVEQN